ncbi:MAG: HupE/UreJ family protein [Hyphomicrobiaceae bacterium]
MRCLRSTPPRLALVAAILLAMTAGAEAHHPMGGETPQTFWHGFLSGLGHPVIGPDHLAFIVAIGIAAGLIGQRGLGLAAAFIAASSAGVLLHVAKLNVPMAEPLVALSVIVAGALLALDHATRRPVWLGLAAVAGLLHGYAFGEAVVGAERSVIGAYLIGIALVTTLIAWAFQYLTQQFAALEIGPNRRIRAAGGMLGCIGVVMLVGSLLAA